MSHFRFGADDYRLNIDWEHQEPDFSSDWDCIDWDRVEWVEIERVKYFKERTCQKVPGKMKYGTRMPKCSNCDQSLGDRRWNYCPKCGCKIMDSEEEPLPPKSQELYERVLDDLSKVEVD